MNRLISAAALSCLTVGAAVAQERPNTILVMDGSGSMWGQIDGVAKITIAQDVVRDLLADFPSEQGLGLTVYGHRERGECTDIETVVAPAPGTAGQITDAVSGIKPLGKTPMTDAVVAAAEALRYTEDKATVILVSDGVETCNPDPCAAARLLEEAGIDFTAHVVGFDVGSDAEALAQMQCIANETGGQFLTADSADQLTAALTQVAVAEPEPEPEPALIPVTLTAVIEGTPELIEGPVLWDIEGANGLVADDVPGNPIAGEVAEGSYVATAYSTTREVALSRQFIAIGDAASVEISFPAPVASARLIAPAEAPKGSTIEVGWEAAVEEGDFIGIGRPDATGANQWRNYTYTTEGNPVQLLMPPEEGPYLIRYFNGQSNEPIGETQIIATPVEVQLTAPAEAISGSEIEVAWVGPDYPDDYIGIGIVGASGANQWQNFAYTRAGSPAKLTVPAVEGEYLIQYFSGQDRISFAQVPIAVTLPAVTVSAPAEAIAGSILEIEWSGPGYDGDYIGIGPVGASGAKQWMNYALTRDGSPAKVTVPAVAGDYVVTYFAREGRTPLAETAVSVSLPEVTVSAPAEAIAGSILEIEWTGPGYDGDYIGIGPVGASGAKQWMNYTLTREGSPAKVTVPAVAGDYVVTYFAREGRTPLAETAVSVSLPEVSVSAPAEAIAGSTIGVEWAGPNYDGDYLGIGPAGANGAKQWLNYVGTKEGSPASLTVPVVAGDYVIKYFAREGRTPLAETTIAVTLPQTSVSAPQSAVMGSTIEVTWTGPDYDGDYIGIGLVGSNGAKQWLNYASTSDGSPMALVVPPAAGDYVVKYFAGQGRVPLAETLIAVDPVEARLIAPASAAPGSTIDIGWSGPDYEGDYIGIGPAGAGGAQQWRVYSGTSKGNPVTITLPDDTGDYVIKYFMGQGRTAIAETPLAIE